MTPRELLASISIGILIVLVSITTSAPAANLNHWQRGQASSYGPGLYGNRTACGKTLTRSTIGVAHNTLPCGTRLRICRAGACVNARVIDRGPYARGRVLDLTAATTRELCKCSPREWGVKRVTYKKTRHQ